MSVLPEENTTGREKTLLAALLLSATAPLATGIAVAISQSSTQVADFIRRTVELAALFVSWYMFRYICRHRPAPEKKAKLEKIAGLTVAAAISCSGTVILIIAIIRLNTSFTPGGNVWPGLIIAILGAVTNGWFWRRYTFLNHQQPDKIIGAQLELYRAKTFIDLCVIAALSGVALFPAHGITRYTDMLGTVVVSAYLLWNGGKSAYTLLLRRVQVPSKAVG